MIVSLQGREVELHDMDTDTKVTTKIAPSNYFRNFEAIEEMVIEGREYVISKELLDNAGFTTLKRGIRIIDPVFNVSSIVEIREMVVMGEIVGYRVRTAWPHFH